MSQTEEIIFASSIIEEKVKSRKNATVLKCNTPACEYHETYY